MWSTAFSAAMSASTGRSSAATRSWTCAVPIWPALLAGGDQDDRVGRLADGQHLHPPAAAGAFPGRSGSCRRRRQVGEGLADPVIWVGTSWKMNKTLAEAASFIDELSAYPLPQGIQPFVLPAHTALASVRDRLPDGSPILLGAQNAHWGPEGEGTGEISMRMAADAGATLIEIGHSERREHFGETDHTVSLKVAAALDHGLIPLLCVGESSSVRDAGKAREFVAGQVAAGLSQVAPSQVGRVIIAYEPIWAIGPSGHSARPEQVAPVLASISEVVADISGGS